MSKTKEATNGIHFSNHTEDNKLDAIRSILLGEQTKLTDLRIAELQKSISGLDKALTQAEQKFSDRLIALEGAFNSKQEAFQKELEEKLAAFTEKSIQNSKEQRQELGGFLIELGTKIQG